MPKIDITRRLGRKEVSITVILLICLVGWSGKLDTQSTEYLDSAIITGGAVYATARGINALVSALQGTEASIVVMSFSIGEVLDPINDLIERFSSLMLVALGSLAIQKILTEVLSDNIFNFILTFSGLLLITSILVSNSRATQIASKIFLNIALLRFAIGIVAITSNWVDAEFLAENRDRQHFAMQALKSDLKAVNDSSGFVTNNDLEASKEVLLQLSTQKDALEAEIASYAQRQTKLKQELEKLQGELPFVQRNNPFREVSTQERNLISRISQVDNIIRKLQDQLDSVEDLYSHQQDSLDCLNQLAKGEECGIFSNIQNALRQTTFKQKINSLNDRAHVFADNAVQLLMSMLLKSLLMPLFALYLLLRISRGLASSLWIKQESVTR